ncbi:hypothetical protein J6590_093467 [Homalodisca vitripennis]|nr:hypothetical protein J6590_042881 [Homalodisca vitripennis]KAG8314401.1 hypothetical protein J6590_093467 [Homalodisca vitripennis]
MTGAEQSPAVDTTTLPARWLAHFDLPTLEITLPLEAGESRVMLDCAGRAWGPSTPLLCRRIISPSCNV